MEGPTNGSRMVAKDDLDSWAGEFKQNYPVVMDNGEAVFNRFASAWAMNGSIGLPFNLILDRKTMTVIGHLTSPTYAAASAMCDSGGM